MSDEIQQIKRDIELIKERNKRVEVDKAWETSFARAVIVIFLTYLIAVATLFVIQNEHPFRNAFIPALAFFASVQSIPFVKRMWVVNYLKKQERQ